MPATLGKWRPLSERGEMFSRTCKTCLRQFVVPSDFRGRHASQCSEACRTAHRKRLLGIRSSNGPKCRIDGCVRRVRGHKGPGLCDTCYIRLYRGGTSGLPKRKGRRQTSTGYLVLLRPDHPLSRERDGLVMEHRLVLFNAIGPGPHPCAWCSTVINWDVAHVDHLDGNKRNNEVANLLFSCPRCNQQRGLAIDFIGRLTPDGVARFACCIRNVLVNQSLVVERPA